MDPICIVIGRDPEQPIEDFFRAREALDSESDGPLIGGGRSPLMPVDLRRHLV